jgi:excinuclease UvrABC ATPase subunit
MLPISMLITVLQRLVMQGTVVIVVEHNLDLIRAADWGSIWDQSGGAAGGQLLAEGIPEQIAQLRVHTQSVFTQDVEIYPIINNLW